MPPFHSSYIVQLVICAAIVDCHLYMYSLMGHISITSRYSSTGVHYRPPTPALQAVFPTLFLSTWWWKPSRAVNIDPITAQLSLTYRNTVWTTALYIISRDHTAATNFVITFATISYWRRSFLRFWYSSIYSLLLNATISLRYSKASVGYIDSKFTLMTTLMDSKPFWGVSRCLCHSSPSRLLSKL